MRAARSLLLLPLLLGCGDKQRPGVAGSAQDFASAAWARNVPFALKASYSVSIDAPKLGVSGTTRGGLIVHRPSSFRIEIFAPLGAPLFYAASDGKALSFYLVNEHTWFGTDDAEGLLRELTNNAAGLPDLVSLMIGRLPFEDAEVVASERRPRDREAIFTFAGPSETRAEVVLDERLLTNRRIEAFDADGGTVLESDYDDYMRVGRSRLPDEFRMLIPNLELEMSLEFTSWEELGRIPDVFELPVPAGAEEIDLEELVIKAKSAREEGVRVDSIEAILARPMPGEAGPEDKHALSPEPVPPPEPLEAPEAPDSVLPAEEEPSPLDEAPTDEAPTDEAPIDDGAPSP